MIAVADLGAILRWVGLVAGPPPPVQRLVSADALLGECIEYLKVRHDGRHGRVLADLAEIQVAVHEWYPTWPIPARLTECATAPGVELDATLLTPVALAAELALPLATTSDEVATAARGHVASVLLLT